VTRQIDLIEAAEPVLHQPRVEQEEVLAARGGHVHARVQDLGDLTDLLAVGAEDVSALEDVVIVVGGRVPCGHGSHDFNPP
jgi:hypothetical protein